MKNRPGPASVVWEFSLACNLNCMHCGSNAGLKRDDELTTFEAERLCHDLKNTSTRRIVLMGGEPFQFQVAAQRLSSN